MQTLTISLLQTHLEWEDRVTNLSRIEEKIMGIAEKTELVVLPEMFSTGFSMKPVLLPRILVTMNTSIMTRRAPALTKPAKKTPRPNMPIVAPVSKRPLRRCRNKRLFCPWMWAVQSYRTICSSCPIRR